MRPLSCGTHICRKTRPAENESNRSGRNAPHTSGDRDAVSGRSGGGAGIQADIKTCLALGAFATTAITALTAQNTLGVHGVHPTPLDFVDAQIDAVVSDLPPDAVKTGMLANAETVTRVASAIKSRALKNVVVDTVMIAKGGASLLETDAIGALRGAPGGGDARRRRVAAAAAGAPRG